MNANGRVREYEAFQFYEQEPSRRGMSYHPLRMTHDPPTHANLSQSLNRCVVYLQSFMNIACRSTQNAARIKRFLRLHIVINK